MKRLWLVLGVVLLGHALGQGLEYTYDGEGLRGPDSYSGTGYTELVLQNAAAERYDLSVMRLATGKTLVDYREALTALMQAFQGEGNVAAAHQAVQDAVTIVGGVSARAGGASLPAGVLLEPGNYLVDGSCDTCPPGQSLLPLTVVDGPVGTAPTPERVIEMRDFHFHGIPAELRAGSELWEVANVGTQGHLFVIFKLAAGKTLADVEAFLMSPAFRGEPPPAELGEEVAGSAYLPKPARYYQTVDLAAGNYVVLCPVSHPESGQPHFGLGMIQALTVL